MRLIDADALIKKIHIHMKITEQQATGEIRDDEVQYMLMLHLAEKFIETVPSAELKQGWIPCSERLPEETGYYLTTTMYREVYCDFWNGENFDRTEFVIAYMPLPEPYKEEE